MAEAIFERDGERLVPTDLARGPWDPGALHGGPTAAAVTRAVERHLGDAPAWAIARLTLELLRPVPMDPLLVSTRTSRPGRKVTLVEATVSAGGGDGREVARAVALGIRRAGPGPAPDEGFEPPGEPSAIPDGAGGWPGFHNGAVDMRWAAGAFGRRGPATVWMRLRVPVVAGEETTPAMRAAAVADFGNGVSSELDFARWRFLNPDLSVHLARAPVGDWVCLDAKTVLGDAGAGLAESVLSDCRGAFGRAVQSLLIEPQA